MFNILSGILVRRSIERWDEGQRCVLSANSRDDLLVPEGLLRAGNRRGWLDGKFWLIFFFFRRDVFIKRDVVSFQILRVWDEKFCNEIIEKILFILLFCLALERWQIFLISIKSHIQILT